MKVEKLINLDLLTQFFNNLKANIADKFSNSINIEYSDLVALRGSGGLIPGMQYRITDFVTTTTEYDTMSAGHPFDVIVTAISENKLDEDAKAALHEGDTYFSNHKIETWKIKYCLDNDTNRFYWADDSENGKGVIYYMKDNLNNECGYDFKNILFKSPFRRSTDDENWYYTFTTTASEDPSEVEDDTLNERGHCYNNKIESYGSELNRIIFMRVCYDNRFESYCYSMMFGQYCSNNTFKIDCNYNSFGERCYNNTFGNSCSYNTFGNMCSDNTFGDGCTDNSFGDRCYNNMFGYNCYNNIFSSDCNGNKFGSNCSSIILYDSCVNNKFENNCMDIDTVKNCVNNIFKTECKHITLTNSDSYEYPVQKYIFDSGVSGISNREYASYEVQRGLNYETKISNNSLDEVKEFCVADLIDAESGTQVELVDNTNIENPDYDTMYLVCDRDYSQEYLTFEALEDNFTFQIRNTIEYKIEGDDTWTTLPSGTVSPALNAGQRILLKGNCVVNGRNGIGQFSSKQKFNAMGNVMSLLFGDDFKDKYDLTGYDYVFYNLFMSTFILNAENLILPATTLAPYCYQTMFFNCNSLITAPELPATTLVPNCYINMFANCTSLTIAPELPATTLVPNCYINMFNGCSNLNYIKTLFLTEPSRTYTSAWVRGVSSTGIFVKNNNAAWDVISIDGIPEGWNVIEHPCISPAIVNSNDDITFYYNDGLYTPKKRPISLLSIFDYSQMMQLKPECDIEVCILSEGSLVEYSYEWKCDMSLNDVIDDLNLYYEDITIVINKVIIESNDAGYYGYYYY